jgi:hypothetical protein
MQKVEGSSPFIRFTEAPANAVIRRLGSKRAERRGNEMATLGPPPSRPWSRLMDREHLRLERRDLDLGFPQRQGRCEKR